MNITKEQMMEVFRRYYPYGTAEDADTALWFVHDIFEEEAKATEQKEPYATRSIDTLNRAKEEIMYMRPDVEELLEEE